MKFLLVSPFSLHPVRTGAARRSMAIAQHLFGQGHQVSLFCPSIAESNASPPPADFTWHFFAQRHRVLHLFNPGLFMDLLRESRKGADGILLCFPFQILPALLASRLAGVPLTLDAHNVEYARLFSMRKPIAGCIVFCLEALAVRSARAIFSVSQEDQMLFKKRFGRDSQCVPNGVDTQMFVPSHEAAEQKTILFFGNLAYGPNRQAVRFIHGVLAPLLAREIPQVVFLVAGPNPPQLGYASNVRILGAVPRIQDVIAQANLVVAPLADQDGGGGSRLKIVEAMACGKNVLCTQAAATGLPQDVRRALRMVPLEDFGTQILDFFQGLWDKDHGVDARRAAQSLDWSHCFKELALDTGE